jgi:hypothetical protein
LRQAAEKFDVVITADQNIEFQQNLKELPIAVVVLVAPTNRIESVEPLAPDLLKTLDVLQPKTLVRVGANDCVSAAAAQDSTCRRRLQTHVGQPS